MDLEEERVEELNLEQNSEIQIDMEVCMDEGAEHVAIDISESLDYSNSREEVFAFLKHQTEQFSTMNIIFNLNYSS